MALALSACAPATPSTVSTSPPPPPSASGAPSSSAAACAAATPSPAPPSPAPWWSDRVFYEVFVRSFADSNGDGIGDLRGLTARLDTLNDGNPATTTDLGVTGLWLMPIMDATSYHGYDVVDYRAIEPDYGSADDFRALVAAAHQRGIAVIVDFPINHTSSRHPWFEDSRSGGEHADWYVWSDTRPPGPGWHEDGGRWYLGLFDDGMPDLNLRNPAVTAEIEATARFWLDEIGVDGFRLDAAKHLIEDGAVTENTPETHAWLRDFRAAIHADKPDALVLGEIFDLSIVSAGYVPDDLDLAFEFGLAGATIDAVQADSAGRLVSALDEASGIETSAGFGSFLTNHDQDRVASDLRGDASRIRLAGSLLLTGPGTPFVYYGEEIGMSGAKPDERIRTPMQWDATEPAAGFTSGTPWEPLADDWRSVDVASQAADPASLRSRYRDLIRFRGEHPALGAGSIVPVEADADSVVATVRSTADETLLVVANLADEAVSDYALSLAAGPLCGVSAARVVATAGDDAGIAAAGSASAPAVSASGGFSGYRPVETLPARSVSVIELRR